MAILREKDYSYFIKKLYYLIKKETKTQDYIASKDHEASKW